MANKRIIHTYTTLAVILILTSTVQAQQQAAKPDTLLKSNTIEIHQIYKPQTKPTNKVSLKPTLPPQDSKAPKYNYEIPGHQLNYAFKATPLQALAMGMDTLEAGFKHYIKAGIGNLNTAYFDAGFTPFVSKYWNSHAHIGLMSQKGKLSYQKHTNGIADLTMSYYKNKFGADIKLNLFHGTHYQYGFDRILHPNFSPYKQALTGGTLQTTFHKSSANNKWFFDATPKLGLYIGNNEVNENTLGLSSNATRDLSTSTNYNWNLTFGINTALTNITTKPFSETNNFIAFKAGTYYNKDRFYFKAILEPTIGKNNNFYLQKDIEGKWHFKEQKANVALGLNSKFNPNNFSDIYKINPFLNTYFIAQSLHTQLYAEGEKGFGAHIKVGAKLAWWQFKNLPMYIQYNPFQQENIGITYGEQLNAVSLDLKLRLQIANELSFGGALKLMNYSNMDYTTPLASNKAWGLPKTMLNLDVIWQPITPLTISAYLNYFSGVDAYFNSVEYQLAPYTDLGFGAEYSIIKNLSAFINCNNLLNKSNERWLFYPSYGTNIYGGLRVKF